MEELKPRPRLPLVEAARASLHGAAKGCPDARSLQAREI